MGYGLYLLGALGAGLVYKMYKGSQAAESPKGGMVNQLEKGRTYLVKMNLNVNELAKVLDANPNAPEAMMLRNGDREEVYKRVSAFLAVIMQGMGFKLLTAMPSPETPTQKVYFEMAVEIEETRRAGDQMKMMALMANPEVVKVSQSMTSVWMFTGQWTKDDKYISIDAARAMPYITGMTFTMLPVG